MFQLDFITLGLEFLRVHIYEPCSQLLSSSEILDPLFSKIGTYPLIHKSINMGQKIISFAFEILPVGFYKNIRTSIYIFRYFYNIRLSLAWFPMINPYRGPWAIITEPVDLVIRPLYRRVPKIPYTDLSFWFIGFLLDFAINFFDFLVEMSLTYNNIQDI
jgi:uncharacterized protein YggT (Ycf19 family)